METRTMQRMTTNQVAVFSAFGFFGLISIQFIGVPMLWDALARPLSAVIPVATFIGVWAVQAAIVLAVAGLALRAFRPVGASTEQVVANTEAEELAIRLQTSESVDPAELFETQRA